MPLAPIARFAVPTGTAAATVVLAEPTGDADIDGRRFAALEALPDADFRGSFEELVVEMVREDLKSAERNELIKHHGYKAMDHHE